MLTINREKVCFFGHRTTQRGDEPQGQLVPELLPLLRVLLLHLGGLWTNSIKSLINIETGRRHKKREGGHQENQISPSLPSAQAQKPNWEVFSDRWGQKNGGKKVWCWNNQSLALKFSCRVSGRKREREKKMLSSHFFVRFAKKIICSL